MNGSRLHHLTWSVAGTLAVASLATVARAQTAGPAGPDNPPSGESAGRAFEGTGRPSDPGPGAGSVVPELDPAAGAGAVALILGGIAVLQARSRRQADPHGRDRPALSR